MGIIKARRRRQQEPWCQPVIPRGELCYVPILEGRPRLRVQVGPYALRFPSPFLRPPRVPDGRKNGHLRPVRVYGGIHGQHSKEHSAPASPERGGMIYLVYADSR